ncbi:MAG: AEC family transporter [Pseudomonadota bacterium]
MLLTIINVVLPVFLLVGAGYGAVKWGLFPDAAVGPLMNFTQNFAIPAMLFLALYRLDFSANFNVELMVSFYAGALVCFMLGFLSGRMLFSMTPGESVALAFAAFYSNSVLLGLSIAGRAYGIDALGPNYAIVAIHAPILYFVGITAMEFARADGRGAAATMRTAGKSIFSNPITMACLLGIGANLIALPIPAAVTDAGDMLAKAGLPAALFGLGGVLTRYAIRSSIAPAAVLTVISCIIHPAIAYGLTAHVFALDNSLVRSATVLAAMAPGVNAYVFSSIYDRANAEVASTVIIATAASVFTAAGWLWVLA